MKLFVTVILLLISLSACEQDTQDHEAQKNTFEGLKKRIGKWTMIKNAGSETFIPFLLASRGITNANQKQGILFVRQKDEGGQPLKAGKSYTIKGDSIKAASWSLSIYHGNDSITNRDQHYVTSYEVDVDQDSKWKVMLSPSKVEKSSAWLINSGSQNGSPKIALRVYNPSPSFLENVGEDQLPSIRGME